MANVSTVILHSVCVLIFITGLANAGFLEKFCAQKCNRGLGGNLCRCNGFHFAGKRTMSSDNVDLEKNIFSPYLKSELETRRADLPSYDSPVDGGENGVSSGEEQLQNAKLFIQWLLDRFDKEREDEMARAYLGYGGVEQDMDV